MIWLRNFIAYRLAADFAMSADEINQALAKRQFVAPGSQDLYSQGFVAPASHMPDLYAVPQSGCVLVAMRTDEKIIPAAVIRREADERIKKIEEEEGRKVGRREAKEMREAIAIELLPRALVKSSIQRAIIDTANGFVFVESGSAAKAENLLSVLRESLGNLPTSLIQTKTTPQTAMTTWLESGSPAPFSLDSDCELKFPGDGGAIARFKNQNLEGDEIRQNLESGKLATRLGLTWDDRISFQLTDKLEFKRVAMLDVLQEAIKDADAHDQAALFDSSLALTVSELRGLMLDVICALGGELS